MQSFAYRPSEFKGSHTDAEKSAQNKRGRFYFAFQFNISENWQHVVSLSPRFVTPTWLLVALADVCRCSKGCDLAEKSGISTPDPCTQVSTHTQTCVLLVFPLLPHSSPVLQCLPFSLVILLWFPVSDLTSLLHLFALYSWHLSSTWIPLCCLPHRCCS